jgi:hypothetical protein
MQQKISSQDAAALLKQAGAAIRGLTKENGELKGELATQQREDRIEKIARDMEEKGLSSDLDFETKVASLREAKNLDATEEAVKMAAPQGLDLGGPSDVPGGGTHPLEHFILTGEDPR